MWAQPGAGAVFPERNQDSSDSHRAFGLSSFLPGNGIQFPQVLSPAPAQPLPSLCLCLFI